MKKYTNIIAIIATMLAFAACSDSDSFNPYDEQEKVSFYPKKLTYKNNNRISTTTENWTFAYNSDNTVKSYKHEQKIVKGSLTTQKTSNGVLSYFNDNSGNKRIKNEIKTTYNDSENYSYEETVSETAIFENGLITKIEIYNKQNITTESLSYSEWSFEYSNDLCTKATYEEENGDKITYIFNWSDNSLSQASVNTNNKGGNLKNEIYEYSYDKENIIKDYGFNPMSFVLGHMPKIYAAMCMFGKNTPYTLEGEIYEMTESNPNVDNGKPFREIYIDRNYRFEDSSSNIIVKVDTEDSNSEYRFSK